MSYPALIPDMLEWEEMPGLKTWALIVPADAGRLRGLRRARAALSQLSVVQHPDHYLHCTLRELGPAGSVNGESLDTIGELIAATPGWRAKVRGVRAFPTAIWADPDSDGRFLMLMDKLLAEIGHLPEHRDRARALAHLTLAYSRSHMAAEDVTRVLSPLENLELGYMDVRQAILAELHFTEPYPRWRVLRRFPFGAS